MVFRPNRNVCAPPGRSPGASLNFLICMLRESYWLNVSIKIANVHRLPTSREFQIGRGSPGTGVNGCLTLHAPLP